MKSGARRHGLMKKENVFGVVVNLRRMIPFKIVVT